MKPHSGLRNRKAKRVPFVNYAEQCTPPWYKCDTCGAAGCKLWREYSTFADHSELVCCDCAGKSQGKDVSRIDANGCITNGNYGDGTDSIGWRVPAVPCEDDETFWGYSSVPSAGVAWWKRLPTRPVAR